MPIITSNKEAISKEKIKLELNREVLKNAESYMNWANVDDLNFFIEECINFVLAKDKDWKKFKMDAK